MTIGTGIRSRPAKGDRTVEGHRSLAERRLATQLQAAARTDLPVLIEGETGTGKGAVARRLHDLGPNAGEPFVVLRCASLPEEMIESELFGRARSASQPEHAGLLDSAGRGTVFLDEVGDLPASLQTRIVGMLECSEYVRIGESTPRRLEARVVASTHRDLQAEARAGRFRSDFYFRIAAFPIRVPPLRERVEDLPAIAARLAAEAQERLGHRSAGIAPEAVELLATGRWPGNLRQLEHALVRAAALAPDGDPIGIEDLDPELFAPEPEAEPAAIAAGSSNGADRGRSGATAPRKPLRSARAEFEAAYIAESLAEQRGNVSRTARLLGVSRVALHKKIVAYGLR